MGTSCLAKYSDGLVGTEKGKGAGSVPWTHKAYPSAPLSLARKGEATLHAEVPASQIEKLLETPMGPKQEAVSGFGEADASVRILVLINRSRHLGFCTCVRNLVLQHVHGHPSSSAESSEGGFNLRLSLQGYGMRALHPEGVH